MGLCRDEGGKLTALELEHYPSTAEAEIGRVAAQAESHWPLLELTIIHRLGMTQPGKEVVLVLAASAHRRAAFEAAEYRGSEALALARCRLKPGRTRHPGPELPERKSSQSFAPQAAQEAGHGSSGDGHG